MTRTARAIMMIRLAASTIAILIGIFATNAKACSIIVDPKPEIDVVAANGFIIKAKVLRGFDANSRQSEILRIEKVYVGDARAGDIIIYRPDGTFDDYLKRHRKHKVSDSADPPVISPPNSCPDFTRPLKANDTYERIAIVPASSSNDDEAHGKWIITFSSDWLVRERALETIIDKAKAQGRFKERPPKSREFGDCMECTGFPKAYDQ
ncbi:MAG: hypothetical protein QM681_10595 [Novosphingobium sp.]